MVSSCRNNGTISQELRYPFTGTVVQFWQESSDTLCPECAQLDAYSAKRSDLCPFMETKTFCANCKVHCYKKDMRERIQEVMKFSGPRMLFHRPGMAIRHIIETHKEKRRLTHS